MNNLFLIYIVSMILPYIVLIKREEIGNYFNLIDKPDNLRKLHKIDVPLIGGIYLYFSFILDDKDWLNGVRDQLDYREKVF